MTSVAGLNSKHDMIPAGGMAGCLAVSPHGLVGRFSLRKERGFKRRLKTVGVFDLSELPCPICAQSLLQKSYDSGRGILYVQTNDTT
ncbi:hypothetical protein PoB_003583900 [Plakobranchus ocellatus]|uniref:Uncharacterized protein n=1 Tax=Plakobranchus ocellatus TaxID=259542 RepID=A0AAV4ANG3_9GAST|nr:hypothetical protein PoB_003583900 [Plakobranchus ocellatus]